MGVVGVCHGAGSAGRRRRTERRRPRRMIGRRCLCLSLPRQRSVLRPSEQSRLIDVSSRLDVYEGGREALKRDEDTLDALSECHLPSESYLSPPVVHTLVQRSHSSAGHPPVLDKPAAPHVYHFRRLPPVAFSSICSPTHSATETQSAMKSAWATPFALRWATY